MSKKIQLFYLLQKRQLVIFLFLCVLPTYLDRTDNRKSEKKNRISTPNCLGTNNRT